jgi:hypothetical protein
MTIQQDTLAQLNAARDQLTTFIIGTTAVRGSAAWKALEQVVEKRDELTIQINEAIDAAFPGGLAELTAAVTNLGQRTQDLVRLDKTLANIDNVVNISGEIVQAGGSILEILGL